MQAAAGLVQMGIGLAVLIETKNIDNRHPKAASGYTIMCSEAASAHQGGATLLWVEDDPRFEVKSVQFQNGLNIMKFQVVTGNEQFYIVGVCIPPSCMGGANCLWQAL